MLEARQGCCVVSLCARGCQLIEETHHQLVSTRCSGRVQNTQASTVQARSQTWPTHGRVDRGRRCRKPLAVISIMLMLAKCAVSPLSIQSNNGFVTSASLHLGAVLNHLHNATPVNLFEGPQFAQLACDKRTCGAGSFNLHSCARS